MIGDRFMYHVDAFANNIFSGNSACVCILEEWPDEVLMQNIATENNLAETAYAVEIEDGNYQLRWFTPVAEVKLCGHATLAAAHVLYKDYNLKCNNLRFQTLSGELTVSKLSNGKYILDFPTDFPQETNIYDKQVSNCIDVHFSKILEGASDLLVVLGSQKDVEAIKPDLKAITNVSKRGIVFTAKGIEVDFVSRCFYPAYGIDEDPATGSAHTLLTPYWATELKKNVLTAQQLSNRVGYFDCVFKGKKVALIGKGFTFKKSYFEESLKNKIILKKV